MHELIALTSDNPLLAELQRVVNAVHLSINWPGQELLRHGPLANHHCFAEHDELIAVLENRDHWGTYAAMHNHLKSVRATLLKDE